MLSPAGLMSAKDATGLQVPIKVTGNAASAVSDTQIDQTWDNNVTNEADYEIQRADDSGFTTNVVTQVKAADSTSHSWTGLSSSTTYYFRVRARNAKGDGPWSDTVSETTDSVPTAPNAPSGNNATAVSTTQINQSWNDNSNDEDNFEAEIALDSGFTSGLQTRTLGEDVTSTAWTGLTEGTQYFTRVRAKNTIGASSWSNTDSATTDAVSPDGAPSNNSLSPDSDTQATQTWTDNSTNEDDFEVQIALDSGFTSGVQTAIKAADSTSHTWTGLTEGTQYFSRVRASNSGGASAWSSTASATTQLAAPTGLTATQHGEPPPAVDGFIRLAWDENSALEANVVIHKNDSLFATLPANTEQYDIDNIGSSGDYKIGVIHSTIPDSDFSNEVTVS